MFQKEGSCTDIISSGNSRGGKSKGKGKQHQPPSKAQQLESPKTVSKAVDVPLRKSDRRKLRERAAAYFFAGSLSVEAGAVPDPVSKTNDADDVDDAMDNNTLQKNPMETLLDEIFLRGGTLSSRSLPRPSSKASNSAESMTKGNHVNMILYVKSPSSSETESKSWPYQKKKQFVWMALEDKKSGNILHETPSVALLAVFWHASVFPDDPSQQTPAIASFRRNFARTRIITIHPPVSRYLCRGADLMRAGIISAPETKAESEILGSTINANHKKNQKKNKSSSFANGSKDMVAICVKGNPQPFAVGRSVLRFDLFDDKPYGYGTKGIGVEVWNCFGDDLWRVTIAAGGGSSTFGLENGSYGNPGFGTIETSGELCVVSLSSDGEDEAEENYDNYSETEKEDEPTNEVAFASEDVASNEVNEKESAETASGTGRASSETAVVETSASLQPNVNESINYDNDDESDNNETETETNGLETEHTPSPDEILHAAVCQALINLRKSDLPMLVGTFYTKHVLPNKPKGLERTDLLKETSYKKFGTYLKQWQQVNSRDMSGLVRTGPDPSNRNNKDPNAVLLSFNRNHEDMHGVKKTKQGESAAGNGCIDGNSKIALVKLYVVPHNWTKLLKLDPDDVSASNASSDARRGTGMLTMPEVKKLLDGYLQKESSLIISKTMVALDGPLTDALYGKKTKEEAPEKLSRKELSKRFVDRLSPAYCLVKMPGSQVLKLGRGTPLKVQIEVVKRQSKKFVTRLRGLEEYLGATGMIEPSVFSKDISKRFAISGSFDNDPAASGRAALPKKGWVEYVFGANIVDELEALLTGDESISDHGGTKGDWAYPRIPGAVIEVSLRKGVPARKKRCGGASNYRKNTK